MQAQTGDLTNRCTFPVQQGAWRWCPWAGAGLPHVTRDTAPPAFPPVSEQRHPWAPGEEGAGVQSHGSTPVRHAGAHVFAVERGPHDSWADAPVRAPPWGPGFPGPLRCCVIRTPPPSRRGLGKGISVCVYLPLPPGGDGDEPQESLSVGRALGPSLVYCVFPGHPAGCSSTPSFHPSSAETTSGLSSGPLQGLALLPWCSCVHVNKCLLVSLVHLLLCASPAENLEGYRKNDFSPACVPQVLTPGPAVIFRERWKSRVFPPFLWVLGQTTMIHLAKRGRGVRWNWGRVRPAPVASSLPGDGASARAGEPSGAGGDHA